MFGFLLQWYTDVFFNTASSSADLNGTELDVLLQLAIPLI